MAIRLRFFIPDQKAFSRVFEDAAQVPEDMRVPFEAMANQFLANNDQTFRTEGDGTWRPLAASTLKQKQKLGFGGEPILVRTGRLRDSLTKIGAPDSVRRIQRQYMELGTEVPYAVYHQTGNIKSDNFPPDTHPPKRPPIMFRAALQRQWSTTFRRWLAESIGAEE